MASWKDYIAESSQAEINNWNVLESMVKFAITNGATVHEGYLRCNPQADLIVDELTALNLEFKPVRINHNIKTETLPFKHYYMNNDTVVCFNGNAMFADVNILSLNETTFKNIAAIIKKRVNKPTDRSNGVHVIRTTGRGLDIAKVADLSYDLITSNYDECVVGPVKHIIEDLNSSDPCGKISILSGPAGTGKTHLLRYIISAANKQTFVIIPPDMIASLNGPSLVNVLIDFKNDDVGLEHSENAPPRNIVFLIEDADSVLTPRGTDNMGSISSLLNISDGIIGEACNIRIVATTNENHQEFDRAIMRSGRLCRHVLVDKLEPSQCVFILNRLTNNDLTVPIKNGWQRTHKYVLADLYRFIRPDGQVESVVEERKLGF